MTSLAMYFFGFLGVGLLFSGVPEDAHHAVTSAEAWDIVAGLGCVLVAAIFAIAHAIQERGDD